MRSLLIVVMLGILMGGSMGLVPATSSATIPPVHQTNSVTFPKTTLVELFTATWCEYCPAADGSVWRLLQHYNLNQLAVIEYHDQDSFSPIGSLFTVRQQFYNINGFPQAMFSGENSYIGGATNPMDNTTYAEYLQRVQTDQNTTSPIAISIHTNVVGGTLHVKDYIVTANKPKLHNLSLGTVLVYDENETYQGSGGTYKLRYTGVEWIANEPINLYNRSVITKSYSVNINFTWGNRQLEKSKIYVVAFVQTRDKYTVTQGTYSWNEAKVLNSAIHPIEKWEITPQKNEASLNVSQPYNLTTVVTNQLNTVRTIKVGYNPSTIPAGWNVKISVNNHIYNTSQINLTLNPGESKNVYFIVNATNENIAYLQIYAQDGSEYSDIHYIILDSAGLIPELQWTFLGPLLVGVAIIISIFHRKK